ncbi:MAG: Gfo/Idh/MocA family oxidoreductase, partial [Clostridia bacterium]|nr:Gfo/Idh/MocA family oxidoreductase [Clostridia bacterium]
MDTSNGMTYAPKGKPAPVVKPGEFVFSAAHLDHGHIYGMCNALLEAGGTLKYVYDRDPNRVAQFVKTYPQVQVALTEQQVLDDKETHMVCSAHITSERGPFGLRVMGAGKDYFADKAPFTTMAQLNAAKEMVKATGRKYMVYYGERIHCQAATLAGEMIQAGEIGQVVHVEGFGPHRLMAHARPAWFFEKDKYGGILCDIGSHQIEQYLYFAGEEEAQVTYSRIGNYANPDHPGLDDFGDCNIVGEKGTTNYFRVDWFTPDGLRTWGDGRTL